MPQPRRIEKMHGEFPDSLMCRWIRGIDAKSAISRRSWPNRAHTFQTGSQIESDSAKRARRAGSNRTSVRRAGQSCGWWRIPTGQAHDVEWIGSTDALFLDTRFRRGFRQSNIAQSSAAARRCLALSDQPRRFDSRVRSRSSYTNVRNRLHREAAIDGRRGTLARG